MVRVLEGDCRAALASLPAASVQCVVTSPPYYGLRDYGVAGQIGLESTPDEYVAQMVAVFRGVRRVLKDDGLLFLNLGDSYNGGGVGGGSKGSTLDGAGNRDRQGEDRKTLKVSDLKPKDLLGIPWRVAFAIQADGWYLRSAIVWHKPNPMPESVKDRPTSAYEMVFMFAKQERYFYDADAIREPNCPAVQAVVERYRDDPRVKAARKAGNIAAAPDRADSTKSLRISNNAFANPLGRNARNVWTIATQRFSASSLGLDTEHFATMPPDLAERCILAGSRPGDTILDPFAGAGTTLLVADRLQRDAVGIELNPDYAELMRGRLGADAGLFAEVAD